MGHGPRDPHDLRRGRGTGLAKPPESTRHGLASLCQQFAVGFCAKGLFALGLSFPSCQAGKRGPVPLL